jgi:uncharacterized damage-inducible protein DinB
MSLTDAVSGWWQARAMAPEEFHDQDLKGSRFTHVDLTGTEFHDLLLREARFTRVDLSEARFHNLLLSDVRISGAWAQNLDIEVEVEGSLIVNGVNVLPYIDEVLNARYPGRETVFAVREGDADSFRAAWAVDQQAWADTLERARRLPEEKLHERVNGEWSFIQTLRHLVFATDSWIRRAMLGEPWPYDALDLPFDEMGEIEGMPNDVEALPSLDEVLALRADRMATVSTVLADLTDEQLEDTTEPVPQPGYPASQSFPVRQCLLAVMVEEWEHHLFANRDLAVLEAK